MKPKEYFDIEAQGSSSGGGGRIPALPIVTRLVHVLHGVFRNHPGRFALALPRMTTGALRHPGHIVRLFAETRGDLDLAVEALRNNERIVGYVRTSYPRSVPDDFQGPWKEYRRFRVPGNGSRLEKCRDYRLNAAENLPFLRFCSKGNGHIFSFHIEEREGSPTPECQPDSYGFSVPDRAFALPMI